MRRAMNKKCKPDGEEMLPFIRRDEVFYVNH
jgi:hypothetical protein